MILQLIESFATATTSLLHHQVRGYARSVRNKSSRYIGKTKEPKSEEQRQRVLDKHKPFVLGRDNVKRDFTPVSFPDQALAISKEQSNYAILRTRHGSLPVYTEYRNGRSRILTVVRRVEGDIESLKNDISLFVPLEIIEIKQPQNHIVIKGNVQRPLRYWMNACGF
eukprot:Partr_v1_DN27649_c1_g1_i2_m64959